LRPVTVSGNSEPLQAYVYVIAAASDAVKIGLAKDTRRRLYELQTGHYRKLSIIHEIGFTERSKAHEVERRPHWLLKLNAMEGEWFAISPEEARAAVDQALREIQEGQCREEEAARYASSPIEGVRVYLGPEIIEAEPWMRDAKDVIKFVLRQKEPKKEHLIDFGDCILFVRCREDEETGDWFFFINDVSRWHMQEEDGSQYDASRPSRSPGLSRILCKRFSAAILLSPCPRR
jgi:predicted GIY-YIG superfamily endonuclease